MDNQHQHERRTKSADIPIPGAQQSKEEQTLFVGSYKIYDSLSLDSYGRSPLEETARKCTDKNWQDYLKKQLASRNNSIATSLPK